METNWQQLHANCVDSGELDEHRWALYTKLRKKDELADEQQRFAEQRLEQLSLAVNKIQEQQKCQESVPSELLDRRDELHERRERWRHRLLKQQHRHADRLKAVAASSSEAAEHLEQLVRQGVLILRSAQRCQLLKPQKGRIVMDGSTPSPSSISEAFHHFWTRFNQAYLETILLQRHEASITREQAATETVRRQKETPIIPTCWTLNGTTLAIHAEK